MSTLKVPTCNHCGFTHFTRGFTSAGDVSCSRCGTVQEENPIVSEVQFGESSLGAAMVQGAMVGADQTRVTFGGRQNAMESREQTLVNGKRKIKRIGTALRIPDYISDSAGEWFKLALSYNFVQGRRSQNVLAACLYVACRKEKTHHMLIDFSARLQISVYSLGATFLKMVKALCITKLPLADPSIFIQHFAEKLDFKDQCTKVVKDAVKLAHRMSSDWMHEGRRPAGIAGACVLLAARMNNFRRSHSEIVAVAHIGHVTLQRRLNEFSSTASGSFKVQEFRESEGTEAANPPSFEVNRKREEKLRMEIEADERKLRESQQLLKKRGWEGSGSATPEYTTEDLPTRRISARRRQVRQQISSEDTEEAQEADEPQEPEYQETPDADDSDLGFKDGANYDNSRVSARLHREEKETAELLKAIIDDGDLTNELIESELVRLVNMRKKNLQQALYINPANDKSEEMVDLNRPRNLVKNNPTTQEMLAKVSNEAELGLEDDDEEVLEFELTPEEALIKERTWTHFNHDFIIAQEKKRLKQEADILAGNTSGITRRKKAKLNPANTNDLGVDDALRSIGVDEETGEPLSAADSAKKFILRKPFSKKINYATLGDLFETTSRLASEQ